MSSDHTVWVVLYTGKVLSQSDEGLSATMTPKTGVPAVHRCNRCTSRVGATYSEELHVVREELPAVRVELPVVREELPVVREELPLVRVELPVVRAELPVVRAEIPVVRVELPVVTGLDRSLFEGS